MKKKSELMEFMREDEFSPVSKDQATKELWVCGDAAP
jgi:hypothetical protein